MCLVIHMRSKKGREDVIKAVFALFVAVALFLSYEPTAQLIREIVGSLLTTLFVVSVIAVVGGIVYFLFYRA